MAKKTDGYSNRELTREMIVGTFISIVFLVLIFFTVVVSGAKLFSGGNQKMTVHFDEVGGLRRHDSVLVRGVPIGEVKALKLNQKGVVVDLFLESRLQLREGYRIQVKSSSMLGGKQLVIEEGDGELVSKKTPIEGLPPENAFENIGKLVQDLRKSLNDGGILTNLQEVVQNIADVTDRLNRGEGTLGRLLSPDDVLYEDLQATMTNIRTLSDRLEKGEGTLGKLFSEDETMYNDLKTVIANLRTVSDRLEEGKGTLGKLLSEDDTLYQDLSSTVADLKSVARRLDAGEGTLGKLLSSDDAVYNNLADTVANLKTITGRIEAGEGLLGQLMLDDSPVSIEFEGLLKDGRDMVDDLREASPITTFSSIFFGVF